MIAELWRLPDKPTTKLDGSPGADLPQLALRQSNWIGWYLVLPDYGEHIKTIPAGATALILDGKWVS